MSDFRVVSEIFQSWILKTVMISHRFQSFQRFQSFLYKKRWWEGTGMEEKGICEKHLPKCERFEKYTKINDLQ
jgi:hypothetical protein